MTGFNTAGLYLHIFESCKNLVKAENMTVGKFGISAISPVFVIGLLFSLTSLPQARAQALPALVNEVLETHPSLLVQRSLGQVSEKAVEAARWQYFPTPSVSTEVAGASAQDASYGNGSKSVTTLRLQQPLWTGGRLTAGVEKAEAGVLVNLATRDGVRQDLTLRVVQIYSEWYGAYVKGLAFQKSLDVHVRLREQIVRRIAQGVSAASDLTLVEGREQQTEAELSVVKAQQVTSLARLAQLLGHPLKADDMLKAFVEPTPIGDSLDLLVDQAKANHPEVVKLLAQARVHKAEIDERRAEMSPELYVRFERQYGNFSIRNAGTENRIFLGLNTHFGAGLSGLSNAAGALARYEAALAEVENTRVSLAEQITSDYWQAEAGQKRVVFLDASLTSSASIWEAWGRQFLAGRKTWLDVMNAARELAQVEVQIAEVKAAQLLLTWRLWVIVRGVDAALSQNSTPKTGLAP